MNVAGHPRISVDPAVCGGRPVVTGTRLRVVDVLEMLANGASASAIAEDFPYIGVDDVLAALRFAAEQSDHPIVVAA